MKTLTRAEEQILQAVWAVESGFLKDIRDAMQKPKPHANTVATAFRILVEKSYVDYSPLGRNHSWRVPRKAYWR